MFKKFVKDRAHNRYEAYCCDDIDERVGKIEEALAALVAQTVPDGAVTLAKLSDDARTYTREINKGTLISEWIGTSEEYAAHIEENGGEPLPNVKYIITDEPAPAHITTTAFPVGSLLIAWTDYVLYDYGVGQVITRLYLPKSNNYFYRYAFHSEAAAQEQVPEGYTNIETLTGSWVCCGSVDNTYLGEGTRAISGGYELWQKISD